MSGRVEGKVAFITGAARGQGRSHAVRLAEEGADIIAVDLLEDIGTAPYPMATKEDLAETVRLVEATGRRIVARQADVRVLSQLQEAVDAGVAEFGKLDVVVAQAGILTMGTNTPQAFFDVVQVNLVGVLNTTTAAAPHLLPGASIILTGSTAALLKGSVDITGAGGLGYAHSKRHVARIGHDLASVYAAQRIRVNVIHPTNVDSGMMDNDFMYHAFRPDLDAPTREDMIPSLETKSPMGVPWLTPAEISAAVLYFASDESQWVTGQQLKLDGGQLLPVGDAGVPS
ncbi:mycofactocin-coupled SDR family oxidoreductase [Streptomyces sp. NBC_01239]|uniref:mycofactocin-coupled SDR family oxidoreductase n=1 Tax=Streptomyces sp. NBC_01239 TaxID=2903792 RepID=UPI00225100DE|nr:mycofactocin-coupled SDR family oxidoreductase [Streptomyces sp. NBC_01239]MCX4816317.1 mycofactocin-coupled SDR family oxidoreductase [Streptomyces sp. NBC_01239]